MLLIIALLVAVIFCGVFVVYNYLPTSNDYKTETYGPGEYVLNDRNYFEDGEDFRVHVCVSQELDANCGVLTQSGENIILTIKEKAMDDSIAFFENIYYLNNGGPLKKLFVSKIQSQWTCQQGRGHTSWGTTPCI